LKNYILVQSSPTFLLLPLVNLLCSPVFTILAPHWRSALCSAAYRGPPCHLLLQVPVRHNFLRRQLCCFLVSISTATLSSPPRTTSGVLLFAVLPYPVTSLCCSTASAATRPTPPPSSASSCPELPPAPADRRPSFFLALLRPRTLSALCVCRAPASPLRCWTSRPPARYPVRRPALARRPPLCGRPSPSDPAKHPRLPPIS
jgi:hypothetical protein